MSRDGLSVIYNQIEQPTIGLVTDTTSESSLYGASSPADALFEATKRAYSQAEMQSFTFHRTRSIQH